MCPDYLPAGPLRASGPSQMNQQHQEGEKSDRARRRPLVARARAARVRVAAVILRAKQSRSSPKAVVAAQDK